MHYVDAVDLHLANVNFRLINILARKVSTCSEGISYYFCLITEAIQLFKCRNCERKKLEKPYGCNAV